MRCVLCHRRQIDGLPRVPLQVEEMLDVALVVPDVLHVAIGKHMRGVRRVGSFGVVSMNRIPCLSRVSHAGQRAHPGDTPGHINTRCIEQGGKNILQAHRIHAHLSVTTIRMLSRQNQNKGDIRGPLVEDPLTEITEIPQQVSMIGDVENDRSIENLTLSEGPDNQTDLMVYLCDQGIVGPGRLSVPFSLSGIVVSGKLAPNELGRQFPGPAPVASGRIGHIHVSIEIPVGSGRGVGRMGGAERHPQEKRRVGIQTVEPATRLPGGPVGRMSVLGQVPRTGAALVVGKTVAVMLPGEAMVMQPLFVVVSVQPGQHPALLVQNHVVESVPLALREEVHLANGLGLITRFAKEHRKGLVASNRVTLSVIVAANRALTSSRTQPGHDGHPGRDADRALTVSSPEKNSLLGQLVQMGCLHNGMPQNAESIAAMMIGADQKNVVGCLCHAFLLISFVRRESTGRAGSVSLPGSHDHCSLEAQLRNLQADFYSSMDLIFARILVGSGRT